LQARQNRTLEISEITCGLKSIAKDLNISALGLSQLFRDVETREDKRPQLADLSDSGGIEQDAEVVCLMHAWRDSCLALFMHSYTTKNTTKAVMNRGREGMKEIRHSWSGMRAGRSA
jgi:hypothetical protein